MNAPPGILPKLIRLRDVPTYLGMDKNRFNCEVRPSLITIRIGKQGIAFDRLDLDAWAEYTKQRSGRPAASNLRRMQTWDKKECQDSTNVKMPGTLTRKSLDAEFAKALAQATSKRRKRT